MQLEISLLSKESFDRRWQMFYESHKEIASIYQEKADYFMSRADDFGTQFEIARTDLHRLISDVKYYFSKDIHDSLEKILTDFDATHFRTFGGLYKDINDVNILIEKLRNDKDELPKYRDGFLKHLESMINTAQAIEL